MGLFFSFFMLLVLGVIAIMVIALWKIFQKAGYEGWEAIIPVYNLYIITKIVGKPGWWVILMLIPYLGMIWTIWSYNLLSKSFGKDEGFTVGLVFLGFIFFPMLGFDNSKYLGPYGNWALFNEYQDKNRNLFDFERQQQLPSHSSNRL